MPINQRLTYIIKELNLNQIDLAEICQVSKQAISLLLKGKSNPSLKVLENIVRHYPQINARWLLTGEGEMFNGGSGERKAIVQDKSGAVCENCKKLNNIIEKQDKLIEHYEKLQGEAAKNKAC